MAAVVFALLAALTFGALPVTVRSGLQRTHDVTAGALVQNLVGFVICGAFALARWQHAGDVVPFVLTGLLVPGFSTILLTRAVQAAGPSRTSVLMNTAPLLSVSVALIFLGEPFHVALVGGAVLIVAGGIMLTRERTRPEHVRMIGYVLALAVAVCFAARDNLVRWLSTGGTHVAPQLAGTATLAAAAAGTLVWMALEPGQEQGPARRLARSLIPFMPSGILLGLAYVTMYEAFFRGRVGIVSPLIATASSWAVLLSATLLRRVELVGRALIVGAVLVVTGGALIGIFR